MATQRIQIPNNWTPRDYQLPVWTALEGGIKRACEVWHRRAGKDDFAMHWTAVAAHQRIGGYWHMLPRANQARKAIWDAINPHTGKRRIDEAFPIELRATTREQDMYIRFISGSSWQVVGSDNYDSLVGSPPVGVVYSEYALSDPGSWAFLRPILAENDGWALFLSTPRGRNHMARLYEYARKHPEDWHAGILTVDDTGIISPETIERERRELRAERGDQEADAIIQQEYFCSFDAPIPGAYYAALMERAEKSGRITPFGYDPMLPVTVAWDLGIGDSTVLWFAQQFANEIRIIDYYESSGVGLDHYTKILSERPYTYHDHLLPHDADASELGTGKTRVQTLSSLGLSRMRVLPRAAVDDGINAVRMILPRCWFNTQPVPMAGETAEDAQERMQRGIDALRQYRKEWDDKLQAFKDRPLHDWCSHAADAFRYLATGLKPVKERRPQQRAQTDYNILG